MALHHLTLRRDNPEYADIDYDFDEFVIDFPEMADYIMEEERHFTWYLNQLTMPHNALNWRNYV